VYTTRYLSFVLVLTGESEAGVDKAAAEGSSGLVPAGAGPAAPALPGTLLASPRPGPRWAQRTEGSGAAPPFLGDTGQRPSGGLSSPAASPGPAARPRLALGTAWLSACCRLSVLFCLPLARRNFLKMGNKEKARSGHGGFVSKRARPTSARRSSGDQRGAAVGDPSGLGRAPARLPPLLPGVGAAAKATSRRPWQGGKHFSAPKTPRQTPKTKPNGKAKAGERAPPQPLTSFLPRVSGWTGCVPGPPVPQGAEAGSLCPQGA